MSEVRAAVGDFVLLGKAGVTMPSDWAFGEVVYAEAEEIVVRQRSFSSTRRWLQVWSRHAVLAVDKNAVSLLHRRDACARSLGEQCRAIRDCESALDAARKTMWNQLDRMTLGAKAPEATP